MTNIRNGNLDIYIKKLISDVLDYDIKERCLAPDDNAENSNHEVPAPILKNSTNA